MFKTLWRDYFTFKSNEEEYLISIMKRLDKEYLDDFFNIYLEHFCETNAMFLPNLTECLFNLAPNPSVRSAWLEKIAQNANQIFDRWSEVNLLIINSELKKELLSYLKNDMDIIKLSFRVSTIKECFELDETDETIEHMLFKCEKIFTNAPPIHYDTCSVFLERMKYLGADKNFISEIEKRRVELITESYSSSYIENFLAESDNWIS